VNAATTTSSPAVANSRCPYLSDRIPDTGPAMRKPTVSRDHGLPFVGQCPLGRPPAQSGPDRPWRGNREVAPGGRYLQAAYRRASSRHDASCLALFSWLTKASRMRYVILFWSSGPAIVVFGRRPSPGGHP